MAAFLFVPELLRSLRWGFVATAVLALSSFIPIVSILPHFVFITSVALFHFAWVPERFYELWAALAGAALCTLVFAGFHFVHLFFLHHFAHSNDRNA